MLLNVTRERMTGELWAVSTIMAKPYELKRLKTFVVTPDGDLSEA